MKILILGGTGAMGVDLVKLLATRNNEVIVTSRSSHKSEYNNVRYVQCNAHEDAALMNLVEKEGNIDAVVDFMVYYHIDQLKSRLIYLLSHTGQYLFLSSSRVYANSENLLTEDSPRLLDVCEDKEYLSTHEYAIEKAREENLLIESGYSNWTVIRPYITYSEIRLQLGVLEKEQWLYRALHGRSIVFSKDIAEHITTLTRGRDVARGIADLIGNKNAYGQAYHITTTDYISWKELFDYYLEIIEEITGKRPNVIWTESADDVGRVMRNHYQIVYDRMFDRKFDNSKISDICKTENMFQPVREGIKACLQAFICDEKYEFRTNEINWKFMAYADIIAKERTPLKEIPSLKKKVKYLIWRYTPYLRIQGIKFY